jgi:hypothetical protein
MGRTQKGVRPHFYMIHSVTNNYNYKLLSDSKCAFNYYYTVET